MFRFLGQFLLMTLLVSLAAIGGWAGLNAFAAPTTPTSTRLPDVARPASMDLQLGPFAVAPPPTVEASVDLSSGARGACGTVDFAVRGTLRPDGPDRIAVLDRLTLSTLAVAALPAATPALVRLTEVPTGPLYAVTFRSGESPRWRYSTRVAFELSGGTGPDAPRTTIPIDVSVSRAVVLVEARDLPADRPWATVTASLVRADDPAWSASLPTGAPPVLEIGSTSIVFEFEALGPGRYELRLTGFDADAPLAFEAPHDEVLWVSGRPHGSP